MSIYNLDRIFKPRRIALIGVTPNPRSVGGIVLSNLVGSGFCGVVYPVNPTSEAVQGIPCYSSVQDLPHQPDLGIICAPAPQVPVMVKECGEAGILGLIIISAGFREIGEKGKALEDEVRVLIRQFPGMRVIGPNCLGIIVPHLSLNASFAGAMPRKGNVAFISQSGALCTSVLDWAIEEKIGFSHFVSIGNTLDVDFGDLIDYFGEDENTESIILYIESIPAARKFISAARAFARTKPIVAYKAGRFPKSAEVAASHTGALASEDQVYDAAFHRTGIARVFDIGDIFDCAELIGKHKVPRGPRLGILTNAGGPGVMATDTLLEFKGELAVLSDESIEQLNQHLPPMWSHGNPVDVLGDARSKRIAKAARIILADNGVDALLVILTPQAMTNPTSAARAIVELSESNKKPILAAWLGGSSMREGIQLLNEAAIPTYATPEQAIRAFITLVDYSRNLERLYETPKDIPVEFPLDRKALRSRFNELIKGQGDTLSENNSKKLLESYGIPVTQTEPAASWEEAVSIAEKLGYPVVLKILSPDITHKSDTGCVKLDLHDARSVHEAYEQITANAREAFPDGKIMGVTVQPMVSDKDGIEMILGIKKDPVFGTVIMVGAGGTAVELFGDRALGLPPLNERLARGMLEQLKVYPLFNGYRGKTPLNANLFIEIMIRLSYLGADYPEIKELDINPVIVGPKKVVALDARVVLDMDILGKPFKPYSHLSLRPYPEEYVITTELESGQEITLRPIKPEDEPFWFQLLESCSEESLYARFRYFFQWRTHEVASRYCFNDYDREIAIVAELEDEGQHKFLGVGRMVSDPDLESAEYAILVADAYQNKGLGSILTEYCMEIARNWGIKKIYAVTTTDNPRMVSVFKKLGFEVKVDPRSSQVEVWKKL
ncbi:bifunctional acetate--CoA ligase family protein/GNAT family N-acetyltransferase [bacterium]|nr:bifunctional acetate--CoA ligase family protein/GNAT family N-acetyltransferase [bacterium]